MKKYLFALLVILFYSSSGWTMTCVEDSTNKVDDEESLPLIAVLSGTKNRETIWNSKLYTKKIFCSTGTTENVYLYPLPKRDSQRFPSGISIGIKLNGKDLGVFDPNNRDIKGDKQDTSWKVLKSGSGESQQLTFQVYMIKTSDNIVTANVSSKLTILQFDGGGGLNRDVENYKLSISGIKDIATVGCNSVVDKKSHTFPDIATSSMISGSYKENYNAAELSLTCSSSSSTVLNAVRKVSGEMTFGGTAFKDKANYFLTSGDGLGLEVKYKGAAIKPNQNIAIDVPLSTGKGKQTIPLNVTPHLKTPTRDGGPLWLFSDNNVTPSSSINMSYSVKSLSTE